MNRRKSQRPQFVIGIVVLLVVAIAAISWKPATDLDEEHPLSSAEKRPSKESQTATVPTAVPISSHATPVVRIEPDVGIAEGWLLYVCARTHDGLPASGAEVVFKPVIQDTSTAVDDSDPIPPLVLDERGEGSQKFLVRGSFVAIARWEGRAASARFDVGHDPVVFLDLLLKTAGALKGRTIDMQGQSVPSASVTYRNEGADIETQVSDAQGYFGFDAPVANHGILRAEADGYAPTVAEIESSSQEVKLVMTTGAQLVATVLEQATRSPVPNFTLELRGASNSGLPSYAGTTDASGKVNLEALTPGSYGLYSGDPERALVPVDATVDVAFGEAARMELVVERAASISGLVVDGDTSVGIPGARIVARFSEAPKYGNGRVVTNAEGAFAFRGLSPGAYSIYVMGVPVKYSQVHEFAVSQSKDIELEAGESRDDILFEYRIGASLRGNVVFKDGTPAPGAKVSAKLPAPGLPDTVLWAAETVSDVNGQFTVYQVPDGDITLWAQLRGRESDAFGPVAVGSPGAEQILLTLGDTATGTLAGQVVGREGNPISAHIKVVAIESSAHFAQRMNYTTDDDGYFLFTDVTVGTYEFQFGPDKGGLVEYIDSSGPVRLGAGQTINDIRLQLAPAGLGISGVVRKATGENVPNYFIEAELLAETNEIQTFTTMTDDVGAFALENLPEGLYQLYPADQRMGNWRVQTETGETVDIVIQPPGTPAGPIINGASEGIQRGHE